MTDLRLLSGVCGSQPASPRAVARRSNRQWAGPEDASNRDGRVQTLSRRTKSPWPSAGRLTNGLLTCGVGIRGLMKKLLEILLCVLHPVAVVLIWIDLLGRSDMGSIPKLTWAVAAIVPIVPFVYVLTGHDFI